MARRRFRPVRSPASRWERVRGTVRCAFDHDITAPAWAYFGNRWEGARVGICAAHALQHYRLTPPTLFGLQSGSHDVRARQTGEPE